MEKNATKHNKTHEKIMAPKKAKKDIKNYELMNHEFMKL
jgi:hypothetical protein